MHCNTQVLFKPCNPDENDHVSLIFTAGENQISVTTEFLQLTLDGMLCNMGGILGVFLGYSMLTFADAMYDYMKKYFK